MSSNKSFSSSIEVTPLIYPLIPSNHVYTTVLLIDSRVKDYQTVVNSANATTLPIVYSTSSTRQDLLTLLHAHFTSIPRIGLFFDSSANRSKGFLNNAPLFLANEVAPYSENVAFILQLIKNFAVQHVDVLSCNTLQYPIWSAYYALLVKETGVIVGASNDQTGNLKYGGDWTLENTHENVEQIYFTQQIKYWHFVLSPPSVLLQTFRLNYPGDIYVLVTIDVNSFYNVFSFPAWYGGSGGGPIYTGPPSWLYDFQLWVAGQRYHTFADLDGLVFQSDTSYPFYDPNNLQPGCVAFWTSDQDVYADNCQMLVIPSLGYRDFMFNVQNLTQNMVCFKEGSTILTEHGYRPVEELRRGDKVQTYLHGLVPIDMIGCREIVHAASAERIKDQLYCCLKSIHADMTEDLIVTGCHCLLVKNFANDAQAQATIQVNGGIYVTDELFRVPACVDSRTTVYPLAGTYMIYHFALEHEDYYMNYGVYANGLLVETTSKRFMKELSGMRLL